MRASRGDLPPAEADQLRRIYHQEQDARRPPEPIEDRLQEVITALRPLVGPGQTVGFFLVGALLLTFIGWSWYADHRAAGAAADWPVTEARVVSSDVEFCTDGCGGTPIRTRITYTYVVMDREYSGNKLNFGSSGFETAMDADRFRRTYPTGALVPVRYDPANPGHGVLEGTFRLEPNDALSGLVVMLVELFLLVRVLLLSPRAVLWVQGRRRDGTQQG